ncbi:MAG: CHAT domain-containing protein, partial [Acidobacteria bacterium]|nr:CHAT domain-containing protein [Acidobacteriota bacterium]
EYVSLGHLAGQAACHNGLGMTASRSRHLKEALVEFEAALPLLEKLSDRRGVADVHGNLARIERKRGLPAAALRHQRDNLAVRVLLGDLAGQIRSWAEIAACLEESGDPAGARDAYEQAAQLQDRSGDVPGQIGSMRKLARMDLEQGLRAAAVVRLEEALVLARAFPKSGVLATVLRQLGEAYGEVGRIPEGRALLEEAIAIYKHLQRGRDTMTTRISLGRSVLRMGDLGVARTILQRALDEAEMLNDPTLVAIADTVLGNLELAAGHVPRALSLHEHALQLYEENGNRSGQQIALQNLGVAYFTLADTRRGLGYMRDALKRAVALDDPVAIARGHHNLGVLLGEAGRLEEALPELEQAVSLRTALPGLHNAALSRANLAELRLRLGRADQEVASLLDGALHGFEELGDLRGEAYAWNLKGELLLSRGEISESRAAHGRALDLVEAGLSPPQTWRAHAGLAAAFKALGRLDEAYAEALLALDAIEAMRAGLDIDIFKIRFLAGQIHHYEMALNLLLTRIGPGEAAASFHLAERAHARALVELLAESGAGLRGTLDKTLMERQRRILARVSAGGVALAAASELAARTAARQEINEAQEELEKLELEIRARAPRYAGIVYPQPARLEEIQKDVLRPGEILLEYFLGEDEAWLWLVGRESAQVVPLVHPDTIRADVAEFLSAIEASAGDLGGDRPARAAAARVALDILPPVPLPVGTRLLVVPDGPLHHIPFSALPLAGSFLVEKYEVAIVPSATALKLIRASPPSASGHGFLGIADPLPVAGETTFPRLAHSRREVDTIAELFPSSARTVLAGESATKAGLHALTLSSYGYIHFATHGWLDPQDRMHSGLRLTPGADGAGSALLSLDEILTLRLSADLVVLSACRSGEGEFLQGEGLVSLTRGFLYAGARAVVVSLWNVDDSSTADFMARLYEEIGEGHPPATALRLAKEGFRNSQRRGRQEIRRWAPFVLVGDPGYPDAGVNPAGAATTE